MKRSSLLQSLVDGELAAIERHAELFAGHILVDDVAAGVLESDAQVGPQLHFGRDARRLQHDDGVGGVHAELREVGRFIGSQRVAGMPLSVLRRDAQADDRGAE